MVITTMCRHQHVQATQLLLLILLQLLLLGVGLSDRFHDSDGVYPQIGAPTSPDDEMTIKTISVKIFRSPQSTF